MNPNTLIILTLLAGFAFLWFKSADLSSGRKLRPVGQADALDSNHSVMAGRAVDNAAHLRGEMTPTSAPGVNPVTGLPMVNSVIDVGGNVLGAGSVGVTGGDHTTTTEHSAVIDGFHSHCTD
ncbi:hypothetical protein CRM94_17010 [Burkholderia gladioli]|uniref:Uncharacterized protein n=1 Tax=Burkholderia gladioli TaxID=28095 RepID=A0A2A7SAB6_BURGA|nr:hypothetical protein [Burkholderia gladioli]PEH40422.1 hypothetical protein CRM94_17010 [Burkholderia gladioli]